MHIYMYIFTYIYIVLNPALCLQIYNPGAYEWSYRVFIMYESHNKLGLTLWNP